MTSRTRGQYRSEPCRLAGCELPVQPPHRYYCSPEHYKQNHSHRPSGPYRRRETHTLLPRTSCVTDDVDFLAVSLAVEGDCRGLNRGERWAAVAELVRRGHSTAVIAERLRTTRRTVARDRARLGIAAPTPLHLCTDQEEQAA